MVLYKQGIMKTKFIAFAKEGPEIQIINKNSLKISQGNKVGLFQVFNEKF